MQWQLSQTIVTAWPKARTVKVAPQLGQFRAFTCGVSEGVDELMTIPQSYAGSLASGFQILRPLPSTRLVLHRCSQWWQTFQCARVDQRRARQSYPNIEM